MIKELSPASGISFRFSQWMANLLPCLITTAMILVPTANSNGAEAEAQTSSKIPTQQQLDHQAETQEMARVKMLRTMGQYEMIQIMSAEGPKAIVYHSQANGLSVSDAELAADAAKLAEYEVVRKAYEKEAATMDEMRWRIFDDMLARLKVVGLSAIEQKIARWEATTESKRLIYLELLSKSFLVEAHVNHRLFLVDPAETDGSVITPLVWSGIQARKGECEMALKFCELNSMVLSKLVELRDQLKLNEIELQGSTAVKTAIQAAEQKIATRKKFLIDLMRKNQLTDLPQESIDNADQNVVMPSGGSNPDHKFMVQRSEYLCARKEYSQQLAFLNRLRKLSH